MAHRKVLALETEICNQLGISEKEYFEFLAEAESLPVSRRDTTRSGHGTKLLTIAIIQLVVGLASGCISADAEPDEAKRTTRIENRDKWAAASRRLVTLVRCELARLGSTVPLIFANRNAEYGGCRANALLTHSCLSSLTDSQRIKAIAVTSLAELGLKPDYEGLAIGDQLLQDYNSYKLKAYYSTESGVVRESNDYDETRLDVDLDGDITRMWWHPFGDYERVFCGTRTPSSKTEFGMYAPMPNANTWKLDFQMVILPDIAGGDESDRVRALRRLIEADFPLMGSVHDIDGDEATYRLLAKITRLAGAIAAAPKGSTPTAFAIRSTSGFLDNNINEGGCTCGNRVAVCIQPQQTFEPNNRTWTTVQVADDGSTTLRERRDLATTTMVQHWDDGAYQLQRFQMKSPITRPVIARLALVAPSGNGYRDQISTTSLAKMSSQSLRTNQAVDDMGRMDVYVSFTTCSRCRSSQKGLQVANSSPCVCRRQPAVEQFNAIGFITLAVA